jgi:release factor glutamine methyltransferase
MTAKELLDSATSLAQKTGSDATAWDARILLAHVLHHSNPLAIDPRRELDAPATARFGDLWARRLVGVPVQHLLGEWDFYGRTFFVDGRALIPRQETETLLETARREASGARRALDLGTGCGILAITLALEHPSSRAVALDISLSALALARANAARHGVLDRVHLIAGDWLSALAEKPFDLIVSNPPYLSLSQAASLSPTVRDHDPRRALYAGEDGLSAIRHLLDTLPRFLAPGAPFLFELGYGQARAVEVEILCRPAWRFGGLACDLAGIGRVAIARRAP